MLYEVITPRLSPGRSRRLSRGRAGLDARRLVGGDHRPAVRSDAAARAAIVDGRRRGRRELSFPPLNKT